MTGNISEKAPVSAYVICVDEEKTIGECLSSLAWCAEIVVVDSGSTDGTLDIIRDCAAKGIPVRLFQREWPGYAKQKQFALDQCSSEWVLNLDADESVDATLAAAIRKEISGPNAAQGYRMPLRERLKGYGYAHPWVARQKIMRLLRRELASYDTGLAIHESLPEPEDCRVIPDGSIWHNHDDAPADDLAKQNTYTTLKAEQRMAAGKPARPWRMLTAPLGYFVKFYILKRYALCGWAGVAAGVLSAQYAFQTEWKHWILHRDATRGEGRGGSSQRDA